MKHIALFLSLFVCSVASAAPGDRYSWMENLDGSGRIQPQPFSLIAVGTVTAPSGGSLTITGPSSARMLNIVFPSVTNGTNAANPVFTLTSTALAAGATPTATLSGTYPNLNIAFGIPIGPQGIQGIAGTNGNQGASGVVSVTAPITNTGTATSANIGISATAFDAYGATATETTRAQAAESTLTTSVASKEPVITPGTTSQYWRGDKTWQAFPTIPAASTVAVNAPITNAGTTTAANLSVSPASGSAAGTMSASDYSKLAAYPAYMTRVFSAPTFAGVTTATQLSATRDAEVSYEFDGSISITVLGTQTINAVLTYADNSGMTTNPVVLDAQSFTGGGVAGLSQTQTLKLSGIVPAGKYRKVTFTSSSVSGVGLGAPAVPSALKAGAEVLF